MVRAGDTWTVPGGGVEQGEDVIDALHREIKEETNMKMLDHRFMFFQTFHKPDNKFMYQILSVCLVEPDGDFISDPDHDIEEIKLIEPTEFEKYANWGGDNQFAKTALEIKKQIESR